jgi:transposase-like protein
MATADVCRRHGISSATFYKWKSKYGGLEVSEARRLRTLEEENSGLKKLDTSKNRLIGREGGLRGECGREQVHFPVLLG